MLSKMLLLLLITSLFTTFSYAENRIEKKIQLINIYTTPPSDYTFAELVLVITDNKIQKPVYHYYYNNEDINPVEIILTDINYSDNLLHSIPQEFLQDGTNDPYKGGPSEVFDMPGYLIIVTFEDGTKNTRRMFDFFGDYYADETRLYLHKITNIIRGDKGRYIIGEDEPFNF